MIAPEIGMFVFVRKRPAVVIDSSEFVDHPSNVTNHLIEVDYLDGYDRPSTEMLIWEREVGGSVITSLEFPRIDEPMSSPDRPDRYHAFTDSIRWSSNAIFGVEDGVVSCRPIDMMSPWYSSVQVEDYQLYPVLRAMEMPRVNMLLADDVGLGKTIEAGMILQELIRQRRIRRILIVCPSSLQIQWQEEMREKFNLEFTIMDSEGVSTVQRELGMDANPWVVHPRIITSMDYLKQPDVLERFRVGSERLRPQDSAMLPWDALVVDEAHNFSPGRFSDESRRYLMLRNISHLFEHKLFLTATPHNGYTVSFSGLLEILDPVRFQQRPRLTDEDMKHLNTVMVRRMKEGLNEVTGHVRFSSRTVEAIDVEMTNEEKELYDAMRNYRINARETLSHIGRKERALGEFVFSLLTKRLLSSSYSFARTWWSHVDGLGLEDGFTYEQVRESRERAEADIEDDHERSRREEDTSRHAGSWLSKYSRELKPHIDRVSKALNALGWTSEMARGGPSGMKRLPPDGKWDALLEWIETHLMEGRSFRTDERAIVFTEYKDTMDYLLARLSKADITSPQVQSLYGGANSAVRREVKREFNDPSSQLRLLVATDAASEGLNLQTSCRYVVHNEIPWNPMRLEQRNGRVDRHGQYRDVHVHHFRSDQVEDMRFLDFVANKVHMVRNDLGSVGRVLDEEVLNHFNRGHTDYGRVDDAIEAVRDTSDERRDLGGIEQGSSKLYEDVYGRYLSIQRMMGIDEDSMARLLRESILLEKGSMVDLGDGRYRIERPPSRWAGRIRSTLSLENGAIPKLVFSPERVTTIENGMEVMKTGPDTRMVTLGHPVMQRAVSTFRNRIYQSTSVSSLSRWTVESCPLPDDVDMAFLFSFSVTVRNALGEQMRTGVLDVPVTLGTNGTSLLDGMRFEPSSPVEGDMSLILKDIRERWPMALSALSGVRGQAQEQLMSSLEEEMGATLEREREDMGRLFEERRRSLMEQRDPKELLKLRKELEMARSQYRQRTFSEETNRAREERFRELQDMLKESEWENRRGHVETLVQRLDRERRRILDRVLPNRYYIPEGGISMQAVGVRVLVRGDGE